MKVFISWSGDRSRAAAQALKEWIPDVLQEADTWFSADIEAGQMWSKEIDTQLSHTGFGIVCLTMENLQAPWIHFEAGALAKGVEENARVVPYLVDDISPGELKAPLALFQAQKSDEEGTRQLVKSINANLEKSLPKERVERLFETLWPRLEQVLQEIPASTTKPQERSPEEILEEVLVSVRGMAQKLDRLNSPTPNWGDIDASERALLNSKEPGKEWLASDWVQAFLKIKNDPENLRRE